MSIDEFEPNQRDDDEQAENINGLNGSVPDIVDGKAADDLKEVSVAGNSPIDLEGLMRKQYNKTAKGTVDEVAIKQVRADKRV